MDKAALYHKVNQVQKYETQLLLQEFHSKIKWRLDGCDSVLDVGCGSGDATHDLILPILPANFERLVGVDISKEMIEYARNTQIHPKLSFELFNLEEELERQSLNGIEPFDHITSFYCLMWIQNQKMCMQNLYKLLKPCGDALLLFLGYHPMYDIYKEQSQNNRWAEYMTDVDKFISPYHYSENPAEDFRNLLHECGFTEYDVTVSDKSFIFDGVHKMRNVMTSISPFIDRIPDEEKEAYVDDIIQQYVQRGYALDVFDRNSDKCRFKLCYKNIVAYVRK